ncbi:MAG: hypothetical protein KKC24_07500, partial [Gammaproteobacteria bacterium]|nr:hypothetical protein [Gammaproteobacteria bacterium]MBU0843704.1 hypothetical protein [Gammaproteobacteria bacterium]
GERRRGEISHSLYCVNSQNRALSLLLPSSPTIQASLLAMNDDAVCLTERLRRIKPVQHPKLIFGLN